MVEVLTKPQVLLFLLLALAMLAGCGVFHSEEEAITPATESSQDPTPRSCPVAPTMGGEVVKEYIHRDRAMPSV